MIGALRLLRAVPLWVWPLIAALGWGGWQWWQADRSTEALAASQADLEQSEGRVDMLMASLAWQRAQAQLLNSVLDAHAQQLADDSRDIDQQRDTARQLEHDDAATADWADQPVPGATRHWLRGLSAKAGTGGGHADGAGVSTQAAAGAGPSSEP